MKTFGAILVLVGIINFGSHALISVRLGGSAKPRTSEEGKYYLSSHGETTEVSESTWRHRRIHSISLFVTHPLLVIGMLLRISAKEEEADRYL